MARQDTLSILTSGTTKDKLAELDGALIESVQKDALSARLKNTEYSGDPTTGSVEINRFKNAEAADYGTARKAGKGTALKNTGKVTVNINVDKEIVEEIANKDLQLFGIAGLADRRTANHSKRVAAALDNAFFAEAEAAGHGVDTDAEAIEDVVEAVIQNVETTKNDWVDGVDRSDLVLTLTPAVYGKLRNHVDVIDGGHEGEEIRMFHGVEIHSNVRQTKGIICMYKGAVAQPVLINQYDAEKIGLSNDVAIELFYSYGTKAVMPDLIAFKDFGGVSA